MTNLGQKRETKRWKKYSISNNINWINNTRVSRKKIRENKYPQNSPLLNIWKRRTEKMFTFTVNDSTN